MIHLFTNSNDGSSDLITLYLNYYNKGFKRLSDQFRANEINLSISDQGLEYDIHFSDGINSSNITTQDNSIYRRGHFIGPEIQDLNFEDLDKYISTEFKIVSEFFHRNNSSISNYYDELTNNKISNLLLAQKCGLRIPKTLVTTSKKCLAYFLKENKSIITKPIHNAHYKKKSGKEFFHAPGTIFISSKDLDFVNEQFYPSLFQEFIEKEFEVRVFFFADKLYSAAIFSFSDEGKLDYRKGETKESSKIVPFTLPDQIEFKLKRLIKLLNVNSGSFDLMFSTSGTYYFLELNPVGMFKFISDSCNYYIERDIAQWM